MLKVDQRLHRCSTELAFRILLVVQSMEKAKGIYLFAFSLSICRTSVDKAFVSNVFPRKDFHMVKHTAVYDTMQGYCAKTAATVAMDNTGCAKYYGGRTVGDDKTKTFLFTVSNTKWKSLRRKKNSVRIILEDIQAKTFCLKKTFIW